MKTDRIAFTKGITIDFFSVLLTLTSYAKIQNIFRYTLNIVLFIGKTIR